jgi:hypothetical protein
LDERHQATPQRGAASNGMAIRLAVQELPQQRVLAGLQRLGVPWNTMPPLAMAITWSQIGRSRARGG